MCQCPFAVCQCQCHCRPVFIKNPTELTRRARSSLRDERTHVPSVTPACCVLGAGGCGLQGCSQDTGSAKKECHRERGPRRVFTSSHPPFPVPHLVPRTLPFIPSLSRVLSLTPFSPLTHALTRWPPSTCSRSALRRAPYDSGENEPCAGAARAAASFQDRLGRASLSLPCFVSAQMRLYQAWLQGWDSSPDPA